MLHGVQEPLGFSSVALMFPVEMNANDMNEEAWLVCRAWLVQGGRQGLEIRVQQSVGQICFSISGPTD